MKSVITAAAKIIKSDINSIQAETNKQFYPTFHTVSSTKENKEFIPESLRLLLTLLLCGDDTDIK